MRLFSRRKGSWNHPNLINALIMKLNHFLCFFFNFGEKNRWRTNELTAVICNAYFKSILVNNQNEAQVWGFFHCFVLLQFFFTYSMTCFLLFVWFGQREPNFDHVLSIKDWRINAHMPPSDFRIALLESSTIN